MTLGIDKRLARFRDVLILLMFSERSGMMTVKVGVGASQVTRLTEGDTLREAAEPRRRHVE